ncbi:MAG: hypothetical protein ACRDLS_01805 [Solirubrobacteraceae bacterium]
MDEGSHDGCSFTDLGGVADEAADAGVVADGDAVADERAVRDARPGAHAGVVPDASSIVDHAVRADAGSFVDDDVVADDAAGADAHGLGDLADGDALGEMAPDGLSFGKPSTRCDPRNTGPSKMTSAYAVRSPGGR